MSTQHDSTARFDELLERYHGARRPTRSQNATAGSAPKMPRLATGAPADRAVDLEQWNPKYFAKPGEVEWGC